MASLEDSFCDEGDVLEAAVTVVPNELSGGEQELFLSFAVRMSVH